MQNSQKRGVRAVSCSSPPCWLDLRVCSAHNSKGALEHTIRWQDFCHVLQYSHSVVFQGLLRGRGGPSAAGGGGGAALDDEAAVADGAGEPTARLLVLAW